MRAAEITECIFNELQKKSQVKSYTRRSYFRRMQHADIAKDTFD